MCAHGLDVMHIHSLSLWWLCAGAQVWATAHGRDDRPVEPPKHRKSVGAECNWGIRFTCDADALSFLDQQAAELSSRMQGGDTMRPSLCAGRLRLPLTRAAGCSVGPDMSALACDGRSWADSTSIFCCHAEKRDALLNQHGAHQAV